MNTFATARVAPEKAVFRPALPLCLLPGMTEMQMTSMTYREQLLHPNWQRKRLEIMQRDDFHCRMCGDDETTLHVHHKQYVKGRMAWEYPNEELVTLCEECHEVMHEQTGAFRSLLAMLHVDGPHSLSVLLALVAGWASGYYKQIELSNDAPWGDDPDSFILGQLAHALGEKLDMGLTLELWRVVQETPSWVARDVLRDSIDAMEKRRDEPPPPRELGEIEL